MSSITIGFESIFRTGVTAMLDAIATSGAKAVIAPLEDKTKSPEHLAIKCIEDEGPETFWKAALGSVLAKLKNHFAPFIPEQFVNIPCDLLGAHLHWKSAAHQSLDKTTSQAGSGLKQEPTLLDRFFDTCIKTPTDNVLQFIGFNKQEHKLSFARFGLANALAFLLGIYALKGSDNDNLPGVNIDRDDSKSTTVFKTLGYVIIEQFTHIGSQWMRYYQSYKEEFGKKFALSKSLANTINEKTFPGNFISAFGACLSTFWFGDKISKSAAGALGEVIPKTFTRLLEARLRRTTKDVYDEKSETKRASNHWISDMKWLNRTLDVIDTPFVAMKRFTIDKIVAPLFKPADMSVNDFRNELYSSFDLPIETLKVKANVIENGNGLQKAAA